MIALGCDHAGLELKNIIKDHLDMRKIEYKDFGTYTPESTDYAVYAELAAKAVASGECSLGLLFCGRRHFHGGEQGQRHQSGLLLGRILSRDDKAA